MKYKHYNPNASAKRNANTNKAIRKYLKQGISIGTNKGVLQYGNVDGKELVITTSLYGSTVNKVEEF
tara:strand:+ start:241 stop:441 length:201 start_codon:yes stop_codon:yes gene_type:complete